jgi:hypothetical protein
MTADTIDRDVLDLTGPPSVEDHLAVHRELCRRVISHRAPELSEDDIADAYGIPTEPDPSPAIWVEISERLVDALGEIEERLARLEAELKR